MIPVGWSPLTGVANTEAAAAASFDPVVHATAAAAVTFAVIVRANAAGQLLSLAGLSTLTSIVSVPADTVAPALNSSANARALLPPIATPLCAVAKAPVKALLDGFICCRPR